jgi:hypothetical protein
VVVRQFARLVELHQADDTTAGMDQSVLFALGRNTKNIIRIHCQKGMKISRKRISSIDVASGQTRAMKLSNSGLMHHMHQVCADSVFA